jgi:hypothetical protein
MFERDVQPVLSEYVRGAIREADLLKVRTVVRRC